MSTQRFVQPARHTIPTISASISQLEEAAQMHQDALAKNPEDAQALHGMALVNVHLNNLDAADSYLALALEAAPDRADLHEHAGLVAALRHDHPRAEAHYCRALGIAGSTASLHRNLADCLRLSGRLAEAKQHYRHALAIDPTLYHALRAIARTSSDLGDIEDAADYWLKAWRHESSPLQDELDLIAALAAARRLRELDVLLPRIIARYITNAEALDKLCLVIYRTDRFADLLEAARQGLRIDPRNTQFHLYASHALGVLGRVAEALVYSREAIELAPDNDLLNVQLGWLELNDTEYKHGWARSGRYYTMPIARYLFVFPEAPVWKGEPVAGRTFLLVGEQGRGDEIQFIRFAEWLCARGAIVDVLVSEAVAGLAATMQSVRQVYTQLPQVDHDFSSHMQRMPEHMNFDIAMLPIAMPYLFASQVLIDQWRERVDVLGRETPPERKRRIGVVWAGGGVSVLARFQSVVLEALKPLFALPGTTWFSIQKGECERDTEALAAEFDIHTLGPLIEDFSDTLAIMSTFDLVVTVDTSVAHLAGAANLPVWVLIPAYAQWRWLQERTDSPWYPSMRLFRQRELGKWEPVIEDVRQALIEWQAGPG